MKKTIVLLLLIVSTHLLVFGQNDVSQGGKEFSPNQLEEDFNILISAIKEYHPSVYRYISTESLENYIDKTTDKLNDSLTDNEFYVLVREFLMQLRCGHTVALPSEYWYSYHKSNFKLLPFEVIFSDNKIFIEETFIRNSDLYRGTEIISIDNQPIETIIEKMRSILPRDGFSESFVNYNIQKRFRTYYLLLYGQRPSYSIVYKNTNNKVDSTTVGADTLVQQSPPQQIDTTLFTVVEKLPWSNFSTLNNRSDLAVLDINSFNRGGYKKYYKKVFKEIRDKNINHLVLDIRDNGGGYFLNANYLLRYFSNEKFSFDFNRPNKKHNKQPYAKMNFFSRLTKFAFNMKAKKDQNTVNYKFNYKPIKKNHYNGTLYLLTNGGSFSMSGFVATFLKYKTDAILIGQETGGGEDGSNAILSYKLTLPSTKIQVNIPYYHLDHKINDISIGSGVIPDIEINYSIDDILQKKDLELQQVFLLLNE